MFLRGKHSASQSGVTATSPGNSTGQSIPSCGSQRCFDTHAFWAPDGEDANQKAAYFPLSGSLSPSFAIGKYFTGNPRSQRAYINSRRPIWNFLKHEQPGGAVRHSRTTRIPATSFICSNQVTYGVNHVPNNGHYVLAMMSLSLIELEWYTYTDQCTLCRFFFIGCLQ